MSESKDQRFEIDLDEIERQLRRSVELDVPLSSVPKASAEAPAEPTPAAPASRATTPRPDPLAELARIVGQTDPFRDLLGDEPPRPAPKTPEPSAAFSPRPKPTTAPGPAPLSAPVLSTPLRPTFDEERAPPAAPAAATSAAVFRPPPAIPAPRPSAPPPPAASPVPVPAEEPPVLSTEDDEILHGRVEDDGGRHAATSFRSPDREPERFDPVVDAYGSVENAVDDEAVAPLAPRRPRRRLAVIAAGLVVIAGAAGAFAWRNNSGRSTLAGLPPVIRADDAPLKVAPANPGGVDIPNQNRLIYERGAQEGRARVVDRQEQPIDVKEVARTLPPAPSQTATPPVSGQSARPATGAASSPAAPAGNRPSAISNALGEPKRVKTVAIRPEDPGSIASPSGSSGGATPTPSSVPPPVSVATVPVRPPGSVGSPQTTAPAVAPPLQPQAATPSPTAPSPSLDVSDAAGDAPTGPAVTVLPPQRPRLAALSTPPSTALPPPTAAPTAPSRPTAASRTDASDGVGSGGPAAAEQPAAPLQIGSRAQRGATARVASAPKPAVTPEAAEAASGTRAAYMVQIANRPTEAEAQSAYTELAGKFAANLSGRPAVIVRADVGGKTIYRVRVGPMAKRMPTRSADG